MFPSFFGYVLISPKSEFLLQQVISGSYQLCNRSISGISWQVLMRQMCVRVLQMVNKSTPVVLYFTDEANFLTHSLACALSLGIKSQWRQIDGFLMVYRAAFTGLFWLSADPKCLRPRCFSSSLTSLCQFPLQLFLQVSASSRLPRWIHTICASLF